MIGAAARPASRRRRSIRRRLAVAVGALAVLVPSGDALADPAGPTDYRSEVVAVEPPTPSIDVRVLGGDSFVQLVVAPGTEAVVVGYQGEEYLWFRPDGTVLENRNSPSTYTNQDRYGAEVPPFATPDAPPDWVEVGADHRFAWHEHRAHWMQRSRPLGAEPGDQILEAVIPLVVDGVPVDVTVTSTWQPAPSPAPVVLGAVVGAATVAAVWLLRRRPALAVAATLPVAVVALVAGVWQFRSLPAETDPRWIWWVVPVIAVVCAVVGAVAGAFGGRFVAQAALLLVGAELAVWGFVRRDGLGRAIVPTDAPGWFDRLATTSALAAGLGVVAAALWALFGPVGERSAQRVIEPTVQPG